MLRFFVSLVGIMIAWREGRVQDNRFQYPALLNLPWPRENSQLVGQQVVDLEPSARSGSSAAAGGSGGGGGRSGSASGGLTPGASPPSKLTLLGEAEEVLVKSWQAFGSANAAVLELVELQNPLPSPGRGGGAAAAGGEVDGGMLLHRYCSQGFLLPDETERKYVAI